jgi:hypothetical protein
MEFVCLFVSGITARYTTVFVWPVSCSMRDFFTLLS